MINWWQIYLSTVHPGPHGSSSPPIPSASATTHLEASCSRNYVSTLHINLISWSKQPWLWLIYFSRSTVDVTSEYSARPNLTGRAIPRDIPFINRSERSFGVDLRRWRSLQSNTLHHNHYLSGRSRIAMAHEMLICATSLARHFHHIPISKVRSMHCWLTQIWFQDIFTSHVRCNPNWADGTNDGVKR